jgi:hypothetical protein
VNDNDDIFRSWCDAEARELFSITRSADVVELSAASMERRLGYFRDERGVIFGYGTGHA